ncbi:exo-1,3-beta-glucanase [Mytilinidion resinicola]|uniref:Exo-1,3-beta-glucanase n=1 Tax=Mytilinidion resinicola TaxID=574789 RepID=A0A6A6YHM7_9PEZI|nr:exo-1,3-beta-glucanase [Mytilinidion resinicola]KAF2808326.1 exo-1,3-beta-glucanase [Mytilinidion resinicola]
MLFKHLLSLAVSTNLALAAPLTSKRGVAFSWGSEKIYGVNIGGWLVLEPWITPSIFAPYDNDVVDEFTLGQKHPDDAPGILRDHWNSFCTWQDFKKIADAGFNVVRIPIGFWAYDNANTPYVTGAAEYIDAAIDWARSLGLKIIIDLHGAPGSQNGYDNSGQRMENPQWGQGDTVSRTLGVIQTISNKYAQSSYQDVIIGIELLNEPLISKLDYNTVRQFFRDGYGNVRKIASGVSDTPVIFHDGFNAPNTWNGFLTPSDANAQNVAVDHHEYQVFDDTLVGWQPWQHRQAVCNNAASYNGADKWTFVGEWTAAMTDCAPQLNGVGARYDGTYPGSTYYGPCNWQNDIDQWDDWYKDQTRGYIEVQLEAFLAVTQGFFFWNFKTEGAAEWDLFRLLDAGVFPNPVNEVSSRTWGDQCSQF